MKAVAVVAHPDDCVIFAWSFMHHHPRLEWSICYLTYHAEDDRAQEMSNFWRAKQVPVHFLGHVNDYRDLESNRCSFDTQQAAQDIRSHIQDHDLVLTHDHKGDYGHLHHKFVHDAVTEAHERVVTFADLQSGNVEYTIENPDYSLLPMHRSIVESFHTAGHRNRYLVSGSVQQLLGEFNK